MTWTDCMTRCLRQSLGWATLGVLAAEIAGIVVIVRDLIVRYGTWAAAVEAVGAAGIVTLFAEFAGIVIAIVLLAAIIGCLINCRRFW